MLRLRLIAVGKLKEPALRELVAEYAKRLGGYCKFEIVEVDEEKAPESLSPAQQAEVKAREGRALLRKIAPGDYVVVLAIEGKSLTSEALAGTLETVAIGGRSTIDWIIGGSLGLDPEVLARADFKLSLSKLTFPHQLARLIVAEQLYRAFKILKGEPYHK